MATIVTSFAFPVHFKDQSTAAQFDQIAPSVRAILLELARICKLNAIPPPFVTSLIREPGTLGVPNSLHFTGFAVDLRLVDPTTNMPYWDAQQETFVIQFLVGGWGPSRRVDVIREGGTPTPGLPTTAPHIHFEVQRSAK